jgi:hypothetical protein
MDAVPLAPADEYRARLTQRHAALDRLHAIDARVSYARLIVFLTGVAIALLVWRAGLRGAILLIPIALFVALVVYHDRILRASVAAARAVTFYERGLARIEDRWPGTGEDGSRFRDDDHLYANDLDLFGRGSLFELLSIARTRPGEARLAQWLMQPAAADEVRVRQQAVRELTPALDLRETLSLAGGDVHAGVDGEALIRWAEAPRGGSWWWLRVTAGLLTTATLASLAWLAAGNGPVPFEVAIVVQSLVAWTQRHRIEHAIHAAGGPARDLDIVSHLLAQLERARFTSPRLADLQARLATGGRPASQAVRALHRLNEMHDWEHNLVFTPIALVLLWDTHLAGAIESWRARHGAHIRAWLDAVAEAEALSSLSAYSYEHPNDPFPEVLAAGPASLDGDDLGHPLLPAARMVRNSVHLAGDTRLLVVSGSNMSGKSTLLRTAGVNVVLALAGAPVRATALTLTTMGIGATLRINDSLQEGRSRFYAEITRIRQIADAAAAGPVLFLLDELFHGTNSHDRVIGAAGVLRSLIGRGAIGLITTHDLALTAVADQLSPRAVNVHFEDWFDGGELRFDFRMKPGPVTRSNAVALMRAVGLDVADTEGRS